MKKNLHIYAHFSDFVLNISKKEQSEFHCHLRVTGLCSGNKAFKQNYGSCHLGAKVLCYGIIELQSAHQKEDRMVIG